MDRIDNYRLFVRVVETGSFSRAARDLKVTQPTVTRQIAALEERLGVRLFNRNTRRLSLTEDGQRCYARAQQLIETFDETETLGRDAQAELHGRIRIATSIAFGRRVVTPLLLQFMRQHGQVQIDLNCEDAYVDLVASGFDLSLRLGRLQDSSLAARRLGFNPWVLVASPDYLKQRGTPKKPEELVRHDVLVYSTVFRNDTLSFEHAKQGRTSVRVQGPLRSNNLSSLLAAVREGFGIAALPIYVASASLARGDIVTILSNHELPGQEIHAVYPSRRLVSARVSALVEFLAKAFGRDDWYRR
ncbi:MAG TPA: LysR family transcriptional regulator [Burkholderiales bacterium]|nr:LysR family transcriptional regulator [Burkholderiales bacterium]